MSRTSLDAFVHVVTFSWKMTAVSTPGMMFWSRRQAAVFRLCSRLVMMYESNSWKTPVSRQRVRRARQEAAVPSRFPLPAFSLTALLKSSFMKSIFRSCPRLHFGSARPAEPTPDSFPFPQQQDV